MACLRQAASFIRYVPVRQRPSTCARLALPLLISLLRTRAGIHPRRASHSRHQRRPSSVAMAHHWRRPELRRQVPAGYVLSAVRAQVPAEALRRLKCRAWRGPFRRNRDQSTGARGGTGNNNGTGPISYGALWASLAELCVQVWTDCDSNM
eukprot:6704536-Prymnesium_polylepis.5